MVLCAEDQRSVRVESLEEPLSMEPMEGGIGH